MKKLAVKTERTNEGLHISFSGAFDEHAGEKLKALASDARQCTFNFRDVTFVNSAGAREWILFLGPFCKDHKVVLEECPPDIVRQIGMIPLFLGEAKLKSLFLQHFCESCPTSLQALVERDSLKPGKMPEKKCPECGSIMQLEEEVYQFLFHR